MYGAATIAHLARPLSMMMDLLLVTDSLYPRLPNPIPHSSPRAPPHLSPHTVTSLFVFGCEQPVWISSDPLRKLSHLITDFACGLVVLVRTGDVFGNEDQKATQVLSAINVPGVLAFSLPFSLHPQLSYFSVLLAFEAT